MEFIYQNEKLHSLLKDFTEISGMNIAFYDINCNPVLIWPENQNSFCDFIRQNEKCNEYCTACIKERCRRAKESSIYQVEKCNNNLIELVMPIFDNGKTLGYLVSNGFSDTSSKKNHIKLVQNILDEYNIDGNTEELANSIKYVKQSKMIGTLNILEALTMFVHQKEFVHLTGKKLITEIDKFIDLNLKEEITIDSICSTFHITRTKLYEEMNEYVGKGIASFIRKKRLDKAKDLLITTDMKVSDIASEVGFSDYNYFLRLFKTQFAHSPKNLRLIRSQSLKKKKSNN